MNLLIATDVLRTRILFASLYTVEYEDEWEVEDHRDPAANTVKSNLAVRAKVFISQTGFARRTCELGLTLFTLASRRPEALNGAGTLLVKIPVASRKTCSARCFGLLHEHGMKAWVRLAIRLSLIFWEIIWCH